MCLFAHAFLLRYDAYRKMETVHLIEKVKEYLPEDKVALVEKACQFAEQAHREQQRLSGEPYIEHPLQVAVILADLRLDAEVIAAGLLHDVSEDCGISLEEIASGFSPEIAKLVDGVTKLEQAMKPVQEGIVDGERAANLRKMLLAMVDDLRVIFIKLADRLHNMRTLGALPLYKRRLIARETLEVYAPLAHRLGIWSAKWQLEDLSFRYLEPQEYRRIAHLVNTKRGQREKFIEEATQALAREISEADIEAEVVGRPKHIYSIHQKMGRYAAQGKDFNRIHDLFALRVLVHSISDCYKALGVVHNLWHPIPDEFDDYIATPKDNGYRSLHTTVICQGTTPLEVQIRTYEMHRVNQHGVAAHWGYKEGDKKGKKLEAEVAWLQQIAEWQQDLSGEEFLESVKSDILADRVFVYTPKGDIKELSRGATPLDFAFRVHTELGYHCIGAKVNGRLVPLNYQLGNGEVVEIIASKGRGRGPSLDWLNPALGYIRTAQAKQRVKQWFRRLERDQNLESGKQLLEKEFKRLGGKEVTAEEIARAVNYSDVDDFLVALGSGIISIPQIEFKLSSRHEPSPRAPQRRISPASIKVLGVGDLLTRLANCCHPLPGDEIIGYITQGRGITVHRVDCPNIVNEDEKERLIAVTWGEMEQTYPVTIKIEAWDRVGLLRDISVIIADAGVNVVEAGVEERKDNASSLYFTMEVRDTLQLTKVISKIYSVWNVVNITRKGDKE